jgi:hypothetical protein
MLGYFCLCLVYLFAFWFLPILATIGKPLYIKGLMIALGHAFVLFVFLIVLQITKLHLI